MNASHHWRLAGLIAVVLAVAYLATHRSRLAPGHVRVTGAFRFEDGSPLSGVVGVVRFDPEETYKSGVRGSCTGQLSPTGTFELMTREVGDGVLIGDYRVVLIVAHSDGSTAEKVHDDYTHFETTPWHAHATAEGPNHFEFTLEDAKKRPTSEYHPKRREW